MTDETRKTFQKLDVLYEPTNLVTNILGIVRAFVLGFGTRVTVNAVTDPQNTAKELKSITLEKIRNNVLNSKFQVLILTILFYQTLWLLIGAGILYNFGESRRIGSGRRKRQLEENISKIDNYMRDLNARIDAYDNNFSQTLIAI